MEEDESVGKSRVKKSLIDHSIINNIISCDLLDIYDKLIEKS